MNENYSYLTSLCGGNNINDNTLREPLGEVEKKMTLVVGMKADGAIIVAADKRGMTPTGHFVDDKEKLFIFGNVVIGISGKGDYSQTLFQACQEILGKSWDSVDVQARALSDELRMRFNTWFPSTPVKDRLDIQLLLAGFNEGGIEKLNNAVIYDMQSQYEWLPNVNTEQPVFLGFSQWGHYFRLRLYRPNMTKEMATILSYRMIAETALLDKYVSDKIDIVEILPQSGPRRLGEEEVRAISSANETLNKDIYSLFESVKISQISQT